MVKAEFLKMKEQVLDLLDRYPQTRNNDFYLQWLWLKTYGGLSELPFIDWEKIKHLSGRTETIRRVRQKIQNEDGKYPPTDPEVKMRRAKRERKIRENIAEV
jgi:hypothetical protein